MNENWTYEFPDMRKPDALLILQEQALQFKAAEAMKQERESAIEPDPQE